MNGGTLVQVLWCTSAVCVAARLTASWLSLTPRVKNTGGTMRSDFDNDLLPDSHGNGLTLIMSGEIWDVLWFEIHRVLLLSLTGPLVNYLIAMGIAYSVYIGSPVTASSLNTQYSVLRFRQKRKQHWQVLSIPITYSPYTFWIPISSLL